MCVCRLPAAVSWGRRSRDGGRVCAQVLYVVSYAFMLVTLRMYGEPGQGMPDHSYFLLFWVGSTSALLGFIMHVLYEVGNQRIGVTREEVVTWFWCAKRGFVTPFFVLGSLAAVNYIAVAIANPYVSSIHQVIASVLQLPFVVVGAGRWPRRRRARGGGGTWHSITRARSQLLHERGACVVKGPEQVAAGVCMSGRIGDWVW
jgi:hypothetical protein